MFKQSYIKELDRFELNEDFKARTIALLQQKQQEYLQTDVVIQKNTVPFRPRFKKVALVCACLAVLFISARAVRFYLGSSSSLYSEAQNFTIADAQPIENTVKPGLTVKAEYGSDGGFGYEGILLKDINKYNNGNPFSIYDSFETLPVYRFTPPDIEQAENEIHQFLTAFEADSSTAKNEVVLTELVYQDGHISTHRDITMTAEELSHIKLKKPMILHRYNTVFDGGDIEMWLPRGEARISVEVEALPGGVQFTDYIDTNYSAALGFDNSIVCTDADYNIYGEELPTYYIYNHSDDYAQNIFNYSVNNARVFYSPREESLEESDRFIFWIKSDCYTRGEELPAITWQQALGLLYAGDYYSSVPYEITEESVVSRIELVYKDAPYDSITLTSSGVSVPFYKFYVNIEDMDIKEKGLEDYGIYYVCAIDPACIEITENYAQFN